MQQQHHDQGDDHDPQIGLLEQHARNEPIYAAAEYLRKRQRFWKQGADKVLDHHAKADGADHEYLMAMIQMPEHQALQQRSGGETDERHQDQEGNGRHPKIAC